MQGIHLSSILFLLALLTRLDSPHGSTALLKLGLALVEQDAAELHILLLAILIHHLEAGQDLVEVVAEARIYPGEVGLAQGFVKHLRSTSMVRNGPPGSASVYTAACKDLCKLFVHGSFMTALLKAQCKSHQTPYPGQGMASAPGLEGWNASMFMSQSYVLPGQ